MLFIMIDYYIIIMIDFHVICLPLVLYFTNLAHTERLPVFDARAQQRDNTGLMSMYE